MGKIIRLAKNSGFCFGVKRAIQMAENAASTCDAVVTLGPIIHNPQVVNRLEEKNIVAIKELSEIDNRPTILRSHGVPKQTIESLVEQEVEIIDATCPYVSRTQLYGKELDDENYQVIILGDKDHPEVIALRSYVEKDAIVAQEVTDLPDKISNKVGIICQTTQRAEKLDELVRNLLPRTKELRIFNTICRATSIRQKATLALAQESDIMIVIGGKNSSNTKQLAKICEKYSKTLHIETSKELKSEWFIDKNKIGLTAGASTPDWCILEVYNRIIEYFGDKTDRISSVESIPGFKEE